jgi:hypothetical protein
MSMGEFLSKNQINTRPRTSGYPRAVGHCSGRTDKALNPDMVHQRRTDLTSTWPPALLSLYGRDTSRAAAALARDIADCATLALPGGFRLCPWIGEAGDGSASCVLQLVGRLDSVRGLQRIGPEGEQVVGRLRRGAGGADDGAIVFARHLDRARKIGETPAAGGPEPTPLRARGQRPLAQAEKAHERSSNDARGTLWRGSQFYL